MKLLEGVFTAYLGKIVFLRFLLLLLIISAVWQMLDLLNYSDRVLAAEGAGVGALLRYVSLSLPQIVSQFIPFAVLLAIVFALTSLSVSSEITIMRAAGMSVNRVLTPIAFVCVAIALAHFAFQELVAVRAAEKLDYWRANDYASDLPPSQSVRTGIRLSFEDALIEAKSAERTTGRTTLNRVTIYQRSDNLIDQVVLANRAIFENGAWVLDGVSTLDIGDQTAQKQKRVPWDVGFHPDFLFAITLNPERTNLVELAQKIDQLNAENADARTEMTSFLSRFSRPMATLIMPLLGAIAGFGVHRQGAMLARAINGSILGFGYFVVENISLALGKLGVIHSVISAFFPLALFTLIGFAIVFAMESK